MNDKLTIVEMLKYNKSSYPVFHDTYISHVVSLPTKLLKSFVEKQLREELNRTKQQLADFESCLLACYYQSAIKYILMNYIGNSEWDRLFKQLYKNKINSMSYEELVDYVNKQAKHYMLFSYNKDNLLKLPMHELKHQLTSRTYMISNFYYPTMESFYKSKSVVIDSYNILSNSENDFGESYQNAANLLYMILVKYNINISFRKITEYLLREYDINYILNTLGYRINKRKSNKDITYLISINKEEIPLHEKRKEK